MKNLDVLGHGDPLATAAWKDEAAPCIVSEKDATKTTESHDTRGHGDPLFHEVESHTIPTPLHAEHKGHGDPLMEDAMQHWDDETKEKILKGDPKLHSVIHTAVKNAGDPLLQEEIKISGEGNIGKIK